MVMYVGHVYPTSVINCQPGFLAGTCCGIRKGSRHDDSKPFADPDSYLNVMDLNECLRHVKLSHIFS